jgi:hypothetical protein
MKLKKVKNVGIILIIAIFSLSSCNLIFNGDIDDDLSELAAFASGLDTVVRLIANEEATDSRTISAGTFEYGDEGDTVTFESTPAATYTALAPSGSTKKIEIPGNKKYLNNFYGNPAYKAKITMEPKDGLYRIIIKIYDTADFLLYNVYEEYYVTPGSWANLDKEGNPGFFKSYDVMVDGSRITHSNFILPEDPFDGNVYDISVNNILGNLPDYTFTIRDNYLTPTLFEDETDIGTPTRNVSGNYYSSKESTGNYSADEARFSRKAASFPEFESITYYAELDDEKERNMVVFSLQEVNKSKDNYARTVTRSQEKYIPNPTAPSDLILKSKELHSLTTFSWRNDNPWQHITKDIMLTVADDTGLIELSHTEGVYYSGSTVSENPDRKTVMDLDQLASPGSGFRYKGTMEVSWKSSNWVDTYSVTFYGKKFKIKATGGYKGDSRTLVSRIPGDTTTISREIELDLSLLENGELFSLTLSGGTRFEGTYYTGRLTGSIHYPNGDIKRVDIINGVVFLNDELWEPGF